MNPIIGLTMHNGQGTLEINEVYIRSVRQAGGIPLCIPFESQKEIESVMDLIDGLLLIGGHDMDPSFYNEEPHPKIRSFTKDRDASDLNMYQAAFQRGMPILGICRGMQVMNVASGGTIIQDIESQVNQPIAHSQTSKRSETTHFVELSDGKLLDIVGQERIQVNSFHHQAIANLGEGFLVGARSSDGLIEAIEHMTHPYCISVQWHPEELAITGDEYAKKIFKSFINAAQK